MARLIGYVLLAALLVAAAWYGAHLPGQVSFNAGGLLLQASSPVALLAAIVVLLVLYALVRLLAFLFGLPRRLARRRAARRIRLGNVAVTRALTALAAGDTAEARRESATGRRLLGDTPQTLLLAAQAARLAGSDAEAERLFQSLAVRTDGGFLGLRGLLRQAVARQDWAAAASLAEQAEALRPGTPWLREERAQIAMRTGAWKQALVLAGPDAPIAAIGAAAAADETDPAESLRLAKQAWRDDPSLTPAALAYAERLRAIGKERRAQRVLRDAWAIAPHPELGAAALAPLVDPAARLKAAEKLDAANPGHPEGQLLLAHCALDGGRLAEARRHAETASHRYDQQRVWLLLADIEEREHGVGEAHTTLLRRAASAAPDPTWRCANCGAEPLRWQPVCAQCGASGRIGWVEPLSRYTPESAPPAAAATVTAAEPALKDP